MVLNIYMYSVSNDGMDEKKKFFYIQNGRVIYVEILLAELREKDEITQLP